MLEFARGVVDPLGVEILPEVHEHHSLQLRLADHGYWVYDFALPMLVLQALYEADATNLKAWLLRCPRRQVTTLDTHDGIGVVDVVDLMPQEEIERTKRNLFERGANIKPVYSTAQYNNLDVYQLNCTYYSALGEDAAAYLLARAIQFFAPGIPQVYAVGLLAGANDIELLERTRNGRDINRHNFSVEEVEREVQREVVQRLLTLMRFRSSCPAFEGTFRLEENSADQLAMSWDTPTHHAALHADLRSRRFYIEYRDPESGGVRQLEGV
jgi:sucrose phosphorylase